jgi:hypothetical protein
VKLKAPKYSGLSVSEADPTPALPKGPGGVASGRGILLDSY